MLGTFHRAIVCELFPLTKNRGSTSHAPLLALRARTAAGAMADEISADFSRSSPRSGGPDGVGVDGDVGVSLLALEARILAQMAGTAAGFDSVAAVDLSVAAAAPLVRSLRLS